MPIAEVDNGFIPQRGKLARLKGVLRREEFRRQFADPGSRLLRQAAAAAASQRSASSPRLRAYGRPPSNASIRR